MPIVNGTEYWNLLACPEDAMVTPPLLPVPPMLPVVDMALSVMFPAYIGIMDLDKSFLRKEKGISWSMDVNAKPKPNPLLTLLSSGLTDVMTIVAVNGLVPGPEWDSSGI